MDISKLDNKQREAVTTTQGYVVDIAGAGSGKTTALTYRYAYLVQELGIPSSSILCVTFTNKAAKEMKERISALVGKQCDTTFICTLHSFCVKVLLKDIECLPFSIKFSIMDITDQKSALKEVYNDLEITPSELPLKDVVSYIEKQKTSSIWENIVSKLIAPEDPLPSVMKDESDIDYLKHRVFIQYLCFQRKNFVLDFTDLITFTTYMFRHHKQKLAYWADKFHYQMVDEAQDNSHIQWELIRLLSSTHKNLFVVGDPDQAIYSFRGARPEGLVSFSRNFTPCTTIIMTQNYRSTGHILGAANDLIRNNKMRIPKDLSATQGDGEKIEWMHAGNEFGESEYIAKNILALQQQNVPGQDMAVLYRSSYQSRSIEQTFVKNHIPYVVWGGTRFFEREEIKNCLAYLRLAAQSDDLAFLRIVNYPSRKLGKAFISSLKELSVKQGTPYFDTLKNNLHTRELGKKNAISFVTMIDRFRQISNTGSVMSTMKQIIELAGIRKELLAGEETERLENIQELLNSMNYYEQQHENDEDMGISQYLQEVSLLTNLDGKDDPKAIKMMTIHQAKGLEFPYVFIAGMSEGNMPHARSLHENPQNGLEEERRLAYVAITRAKKKLFITDADGYNTITGSQRTTSRFIYEINPFHIQTIMPVEESVWQGSKESCVSDFVDSYKKNDRFLPGQIVNHSIFGRGVVLELNRDKMEYSVRFDNTGNVLPISINFKGLKSID